MRMGGDSVDVLVAIKWQVYISSKISPAISAGYLARETTKTGIALSTMRCRAHFGANKPGMAFAMVVVSFLSFFKPDRKIFASMYQPSG